MWIVMSILVLQRDLVSTVGEAAAVGAAGVVMWGGTRDYNTEVTTRLYV